MNDLRHYSFIAYHPGEQPCRVFVGFIILDGPSNQYTVKQVDDRIGIFEKTFDIGSEPRDIPRPYLVWSRDEDR